MNIKFRENWHTRNVEAFVDGKLVFKAPEYVTTAKYMQRAYGLTDDQLWSIYYDYKEDYDSIG